MTKAISTNTTPTRARRRSLLINQIRPLALNLGVLWVRDNGSLKHGKDTMCDCTDAQLAEIYAAAAAAAGRDAPSSSV